MHIMKCTCYGIAHYISDLLFSGTRFETKLCACMGKHGYQLCQPGSSLCFLLRVKLSNIHEMTNSFGMPYHFLNSGYVRGLYSLLCPCIRNESEGR